MTHIPYIAYIIIGTFFVLHIAMASIVVLTMFKALGKRIKQGDKD